MDLLDSSWKGKVALDPLPNNSVRGSLKAFGKEKALDFRMGTEDWVDKTASEVFARRANGR